MSGNSAAAENGVSGDPALSEQFGRRIRPVLNRIDELRRHGLQRELKLPMVAVIGDQSVGKSSVLEAISGIDFPRGKGVVTRCPLQLSMRCHTAGAWAGRISYKALDGEPVDKTLNSPEEVDKEVREAQNRMTNSPGEISLEQISLTVQSPTVPDLTLLDLPGIARYSSTCGSDVGDQTKRLISRYIGQQQVLILVVIPCHSDIETVEALSLAKAADPAGERTIGVMTFPDMVNKGAEEDTMIIAMNKKIPLKKGYVMVKCRSLQELGDKIPLTECRQREDSFFRDHEFFTKLSPKQRGIGTLAEKLVTELFLSIKRNIPQLLEEIRELKKKYQQELVELGEPIADTKDQKVRLLNEMSSKFATQVTIASRGEMNASSQLFAQCRRHCLELGRAVEAAHPRWVVRKSARDPWQPPAKIQAIVADFRGREPPGYDYIFPIIEKVFREEYLGKLKNPSELLLERVADEVMKTIRDCAKHGFKGFDDLADIVVDNSNEEVAKVLEEARQDLERLFKQENRFFSQDRLFMYRMSKIEEKLYKREKQQQDPEADRPKDPDSCERIRRGVETYLEIVSERLADTIPQSVLHFMLDVAAERVCCRVTELTSDSDDLLQLLQEDPYCAMKRGHLQERMEQLQLAEKDFNGFKRKIASA